MNGVVSPCIAWRLYRRNRVSSAASLFRCYRAVYPASVRGTVEHVYGASLRISGLKGASPAAPVIFRGGAIAIITDLWHNDTVSAVLVSGHVEAREAAVLAPAPFDIVAGPGLLGRVVDPLGRPLDGLGCIDHVAATAAWNPLELAPPPQRAVPLLRGVESAHITERASVRAALPCGRPLFDAFSPLVRGSCAAIVGSSHSLATEHALRTVRAVAAVNAARAARRRTGWVSDDEDDAVPPTRCVYVCIGSSLAVQRGIVRSLRSSGAMAWTTVIAAPMAHAWDTTPSSSASSAASLAVGASYLAPYAGAAIAEHWARCGGHTLVVYDDLGDHTHAARAVSGVDWGRLGNAAAPALQGSLFDRCAQYSDDAGAGSVTALALLTAAQPRGSEVTREDSATRRLVRASASLADSTLDLDDLRAPVGVRSARAAHRMALAAWLSRVCARPGHAAQGAALRHYVARANAVALQLRDVVTRAAAATEIGVDISSDLDGMLDVAARMRALMDSEFIGDEHHESDDQARHANAGEPTSSVVAGATAPMTGGSPIGNAASNGASLAAPGGSPSTASISALVDKMTPEQRAAFAAVTAARSSAARTRGGVAAAPRVATAAQRMPQRESGIHQPSGSEYLLGRAENDRISVSAAAPFAVEVGEVHRDVADDVNSSSCFSGDPARVLLQLFIATHAYTQRVPLRLIPAYEAGLFAVVSAAPAPTNDDDEGNAGNLRGNRDSGFYRAAATDMLRVRWSTRSAAAYTQLPAASGSGGDLLHDDASQHLRTPPVVAVRTHGDDVTDGGRGSPRSLLDAVLDAQVCPAMIAALERIDIDADLRSAIERLARAARREHDASDAAAAAARATAAAEEARAAQQPRNWFAVLVNRGAAPRAATPAPRAAAPHAVSVTEEQSSSPAWAGHVRLEAGIEWTALTTPWRQLHAVVAEYTRVFCGEPPA